MHYEEKNFVETADAEMLELVAHARELTMEYAQCDPRNMENRTRILRELMGHVGENVVVDRPFYCDHGKNIFVGDNVIINMNCTFVDNESIRIGSNVLIASNVQIYTSSHPVLPEARLVEKWQEKESPFFRTYALPVEIQDNVWIGGGCIILPGVTIGKNSVIGAGSVVTRSIPENCVAVGNPCRVQRTFEPAEKQK